MKSTVENLSPTRVRLAVEVPFDELKPSLDKAYKAIASQIRVPGFRPGKVPARIIDQRVGRGSVLQEAVNDVLPRLYGEAARENSLNPLGQPEIDITTLDDSAQGSLAFTAEVDIRPEIPLPDLDGLAVQVDDAEVTDEAVDEQLDELRDRFGTLTGVERATEVGDYVSLDLATTVGGEEIAEGSSKGLSYVVGSGDLIDGLDEAVTGKSAGESASFTTLLMHGEHAGQDGEVTATVKSVKVKELPELDDDFAQLASEFDTVDELRDDLRERLGRVRVLEQGAQARDKLLEQLIEQIEFPLPDSAVDAEVEYRQHDVIHGLDHNDDLLAKYLEAQGTTREQWDAETREGAEQSVRAQFILDAIAENKQVQVGDSELTQYIVQQAQRYQLPPQEFANQVVQNGSLPMLMADIRRNKALAAVLESATITDASGATIDLEALLGEPASGPVDDASDGVSSEDEPAAATDPAAAAADTTEADEPADAAADAVDADADPRS